MFCTTGVLSASGVRLAPALYVPEKIFVREDGGGKTPVKKNVACTRPNGH